MLGLYKCFGCLCVLLRMQGLSECTFQPMVNAVPEWMDSAQEVSDVAACLLSASLQRNKVMTKSLFIPIQNSIYVTISLKG